MEVERFQTVHCGAAAVAVGVEQLIGGQVGKLVVNLQRYAIIQRAIVGVMRIIELLPPFFDSFVNNWNSYCFRIDTAAVCRIFHLVIGRGGEIDHRLRGIVHGNPLRRNFKPAVRDDLETRVKAHSVVLDRAVVH